MKRFGGLTLAALGVCAGSAGAQDLAISETISSVEFSFNNRFYQISRTGDGACPPNCIQPQQAAAGVATLGEIELIAFVQTALGQGTGLLIDARLPGDFATGSIPGAVNIPGATLSGTNPYRKEILLALGVRETSNGALDFSGAQSLVLFDRGATSPVAADAVRDLLDAGYPANKLMYYRAGLMGWDALGLTVTGRGDEG